MFNSYGKGKKDSDTGKSGSFVAVNAARATAIGAGALAGFVFIREWPSGRLWANRKTSRL